MSVAVENDWALEDAAAPSSPHFVANTSDVRAPQHPANEQGSGPRVQPNTQSAKSTSSSAHAGIAAARAALLQGAPASPRTTTPAKPPASTPPAASQTGVKPKQNTSATNQPPATPVTDLDWPALESAVANCQACQLCTRRNRTVFGSGDRQASLMLVGEAPGADEDRQGEPFVGNAGQLLTRMLTAIELPREQVYIGNIIKCRPPYNRDPQPEEIAACRAFIERQIELVEPHLLVCLGRIAAQALLQTSASLRDLRGRWHSFGPSQIPVLVTYHPSYYLRSPTEKARGWDDLQQIARRLRKLPH
ncbi:hypothetical protein CKO36_06020 [Rhabdochromatium marinum]|nr:hypothetical protein [Rhabdochromatium marinum]